VARFIAKAVGKQTMVCAASGSRCIEEINNYFLLIEYAHNPTIMYLHAASSPAGISSSSASLEICALCIRLNEGDFVASRFFFQPTELEKTV